MCFWLFFKRGLWLHWRFLDWPWLLQAIALKFISHLLVFQISILLNSVLLLVLGLDFFRFLIAFKVTPQGQLIPSHLLSTYLNRWKKQVHFFVSNLPIYDFSIDLCIFVCPVPIFLPSIVNFGVKPLSFTYLFLVCSLSFLLKLQISEKKSSLQHYLDVGNMSRLVLFLNCHPKTIGELL